MDKGVLLLIELFVVVGAVFGIGFWQLASLRKDRRNHRKAGSSGGPGVRRGED